MIKYISRNNTVAEHDMTMVRLKTAGHSTNAEFWHGTG
jgi:hypothetical protein